MANEPISWLTFAVGAAVALALSMLWYSPRMFGKGWTTGTRLTAEDGAQMPKIALFAHVISLLLLASLLAITATTHALGNAAPGILTAAAFAVSTGAFAKKTAFAMAVDGGFVLVTGVIMIAARDLL